MQQYKYLIVGGGLAADAAARGIRELDPDGSIAILSREPDPPYTRPHLSKGLWKGRPLEKIWRNTEALGVDLFLSHKVTAIDGLARRLRDEAGEEYAFEKALLATGGTPSRLPFGGDDIIYYRSLGHYRQLRALSDERKDFLVIGGGFIGSEIAAALNMAGRRVTMIFPEPGISANVFPADLSQHLNAYYADKGVEVVPGDVVTDLERRGPRLVARTRGGRELEVDGVVAGIGIRPNVELAEQAGLQVDNGILVDDQLRTSSPDIFAAGDAANFHHAALGRRVRVEHEDNAIHMGKQAGRNMAGAGEPYTHVPMFYSDLFDLGYEAVGDTSTKLETVADWKEPFTTGVIYYLGEGRVRGVLLWNIWKTVDKARLLMAEPGPFTAKDLKGRLG